MKKIQNFGVGFFNKRDICRIHVLTHELVINQIPKDENHLSNSYGMVKRRKEHSTMGREENKNTSRVVVIDKVQSRGMKTLHESHNFDFDKELVHNYNFLSHKNLGNLISKLLLIMAEPFLE
jgi:hypothetical protein